MWLRTPWMLKDEEDDVAWPVAIPLLQGRLENPLILPLQVAPQDAPSHNHFLNPGRVMLQKVLCQFIMAPPLSIAPKYFPT